MWSFTAAAAWTPMPPWMQPRGRQCRGSSDSMARYSGGGGDPIQWRRWCPCIGDGGGGGGLIPSLAARPLDRIRVTVGGMAAHGEPRSPSPHPHLPFMCAVRQGPTNRIRVGLPRSGSRDKGLIGRWAYWWRSTNILSLDLIPSFTFISFIFVHSITD